MVIQLRKAQRVKAPLKISLSGPPGSGKTYSALLLARGMASAWNKICLIDTENKSGDLYDQLGDYNVITLEAPFMPDKYIAAIQAAENAGMEVAILDSCTHVWSGQGGLLEYNSALGGRYQDWAKTTPLYQKWLSSILQSPMDIICTIRKKTHYDVIVERGKMKVEKKGLEDQIRDGFEYEVSLALTLNQNNMTDLALVKDRTRLFKGKQDFIITEETGRLLKEWKNSGKDLPPQKDDLKTEIVKLLNGQGFYPNIKEEYETMILGLTGVSLLPENYQQIIEKLQQNGNTNTNKNALGTTPGDQSAGGSAPENNRASEK